MGYNLCEIYDDDMNMIELVETINTFKRKYKFLNENDLMYYKNRILVLLRRDSWIYATHSFTYFNTDVPVIRSKLLNIFKSGNYENAAMYYLTEVFDYEKYLAIREQKKSELIQVYREYVNSILIFKNGEVYNPLNQMYWNKRTGMWMRECNGCIEWQIAV